MEKPIQPQPKKKKTFLGGCLLILLIGSLSFGLFIFYLFRMAVPRLPNRFALCLYLSGDVPEFPSQTPYAALIPGGRKPLTVFEIVNALDQAATDHRVTGLVLSLRATSLGLARIQELSHAIERFRKNSKKPVIAFIDTGDDSDYLVSLPADQIIMAPAGFLALNGINIEFLYFKSFFDRLGIEFQMVRHGAYKSATEPFTRDTMSPEAREMYQWILDSFRHQLTGMLTRYRPRVQKKWSKMLQRGLLTASTALDLNAVDKLESWANMRSRLKKKWAHRWITMRRYVRALEAMPQKGDVTCALVFAVGGIVDGRGVPGDSIGSDTYTSIFRRIARSQIPCVLIRDDSPGGSGTASDEIYEAINLLRKKGKKVVVSMGDVAGSGGYYIAMNADRIVAQPGTITGSIGVLAGKVNFKRTMEKIGIHVESMKGAPESGFWSPFQPLTDEQLKALQEETGKFYWDFVRKVARHRKKTPEQIHAIAQGRVWTGEQAHKNGLVDVLGGFHEATQQLIKAIGKDPRTTRVRWKIYPRKKSWFEIFSEYLETRQSEIPRSLVREQTLRKHLQPYLILLNEPITLLMPPIIAVVSYQTRL